MKHRKTNRKTISYVPIQVVALLAAFGFAQPALSECVQSDPAAATIVDIDATSGCANVQGQEGCTISKVANGSCSYDGQYGKFTVNSELIDGKLSWWLVEGYSTKIDTAIIGGGSGGKNNCGYVHEVDVIKGSGGDCKGDIVDGECTGDYQNITGLAVCTDGIDDEAPPVAPVAKPLDTCPSINDDETLDGVGIQCPTDQTIESIVCNFEKGDYAWGTIGANEQGGQEQVCCRCNPQTADVKAFFVSDDPEENNENLGTYLLESDPAQEVIITLERTPGDPCISIVSGGRVYKQCW